MAREVRSAFMSHTELSVELSTEASMLGVLATFFFVSVGGEGRRASYSAG